MTSHRRRTSTYQPIVGWALEILIGSVLGVIAGVVLLLATLWVMALYGTAW